jgi:toxin HigB-1
LGDQVVGDSTTERVWSRQFVKAMDRNLQRTALRKLTMLGAAEVLDDLRVPPGQQVGGAQG